MGAYACRRALGAYTKRAVYGGGSEHVIPRRLVIQAFVDDVALKPATAGISLLGMLDEVKEELGFFERS